MITSQSNSWSIQLHIADLRDTAYPNILSHSTLGALGYTQCPRGLMAGKYQPTLPAMCSNTRPETLVRLCWCPGLVTLPHVPTTGLWQTHKGVDFLSPGALFAKVEGGPWCISVIPRAQMSFSFCDEIFAVDLGNLIVQIHLEGFR